MKGKIPNEIRAQNYYRFLLAITDVCIGSRMLGVVCVGVQYVYALVESYAQPPTTGPRPLHHRLRFSAATAAGRPATLNFSKLTLTYKLFINEISLTILLNTNIIARLILSVFPVLQCIHIFTGTHDLQTL